MSVVYVTNIEKLPLWVAYYLRDAYTFGVSIHQSKNEHLELSNEESNFILINILIIKIRYVSQSLFHPKLFLKIKKWNI